MSINVCCKRNDLTLASNMNSYLLGIPVLIFLETYFSKICQYTAFKIKWFRLHVPAKFSHHQAFLLRTLINIFRTLTRVKSHSLQQSNTC